MQSRQGSTGAQPRTGHEVRPATITRTPLHELTTALEVDTPIRTEDGADVTGRVEISSRCTATGHAITCCRVAGGGEGGWHRVDGGETDLSDPAELPFHHATVIARCVQRGAPSA